MAVTPQAEGASPPTRPPTTPPAAFDFDAFAQRTIGRGLGELERLRGWPRLRRAGRALLEALGFMLLLWVLGIAIGPLALVAALPIPLFWAWRALKPPVHSGGMAQPPLGSGSGLVRFAGRVLKALARLAGGLALCVLVPLATALLGIALGAGRVRNVFATHKSSLVDLPRAARAIHRVIPIGRLFGKANRHAFGLTFVTRHEDVRAALLRDDVLAVSMYDVRMKRTSGPFLLGHDGERHLKEVAQAQRAVRDGAQSDDRLRVERLVAEASRALVAAASQRDTRSIDVVGELGNVVPLLVAQEYFGVPDTPDQRLLPYLQTMSFFIFNFWIGGPYGARAERAAERLLAHLRALIDARLANPGNAPDDVTQRLIRAALDEHAATGNAGPLPDGARAEIASNLLGLLSGSIVATIGTFVGAVERLVDLPPDTRDAVARVCRDGGSALDPCVTEACRFAAFPPTLYRIAKRDFALAPGTPHERIAKQGAVIVTTPILANLDASVYASPEQFQLGRFAGRDAPPLPLNFGWGTHRCLGEHLGKTMVREMLRAVFSQANVRRAPWPDGKCAKGRGLPAVDFADRLVLQFDPAPRAG